MGNGVSTPRHNPHNRLIVLIDMDDTLTEYEEYFLQLYREKYPNQPYVPCDQRSDDIATDYQRLPGASKNMREIVESIYKNKGFIRDIPVIPGAVKALKEMERMKGVDVLIVATPLYRPTEYKYSVPEKYEWIENHFGKEWIDRVVLTWDKTVLEGHVLIDDKVNITGDIECPTWEHVLFKSCPNRKINGIKRLNNWTDGHWKEIIEDYKNKLRSSY